MRERRFARGPMLHRELREAHAEAMRCLRAVDAELEQLLARRRGQLEALEGLRVRVDRRYGTRHGGRRRPMVDEPPVPPTPPDAVELWGVDLRAVSVRLLRRHGAHRLRDLHGLLHCYGYAVAGPRPVKDLADAMRYELRCGRVRRIERGVYEADPSCEDEVPYPRWLGDPPEDRPPLPWSAPVTHPGPPLVDPDLAEDPALWAGDGYADPADPVHPGDPAPPAPPPGEPPTPTASAVGSDSVPNRTPHDDEEGRRAGKREPPAGRDPDEPP